MFKLCTQSCSPRVWLTHIRARAGTSRRQSSRARRPSARVAASCNKTGPNAGEPVGGMASLGVLVAPCWNIRSGRRRRTMPTTATRTCRGGRTTTCPLTCPPWTRRSTQLEGLRRASAPERSRRRRRLPCPSWPRCRCPLRPSSRMAPRRGSRRRGPARTGTAARAPPRRRRSRRWRCSASSACCSLC